MRRNSGEGLDGLESGQDVLLLTWLHRAERDVLKVHPRGNRDAPLKGVFATRSPARPNPVGLHRVKILELERETGRLSGGAFGSARRHADSGYKTSAPGFGILQRSVGVFSGSRDHMEENQIYIV